ncbi:MAG: hypothetical protein M3364_08715 [Actinomycetota bacterium]|nr:hypothetical protein [Actinomycetota bacterium]
MGRPSTRAPARASSSFPTRSGRLGPRSRGRSSSPAFRPRELRDVDELERVVDEGIAAYGEHVTMLLGRACVAAQRGQREQALELLSRAAADEDFGQWVRDEATQEPLLEPVRDDPSFPR